MSVEEYEDLVGGIDFIKSFIPCPNASICQKLVYLVDERAVEDEHMVLKICRSKRSSYYTCITYIDDSHVCDLFPVFIGSSIDAQIIKHFSPNFDLTKCDAFVKLRGMIYINGSVAYIPYLLTNRKEMGHRVKKGDEIFCLYIYDEQHRGHKLYIDSNNRVVYRNHRGENNADISEAIFVVDAQHLDHHHILDAFKCLYHCEIEIDGLENKLTLSPINILFSLLYIAKTNPKKARDNFSRIERFASLKISYQNCNDDKSSRGDRFKNVKLNFRNIQPNQITSNGMERVVIRPIPKNVSKTSIPKNTEYFFCPVDKNISIDSPNKRMTLLPNVVVTNVNNTKNDTINNLLVMLLDGGLIKIRTEGRMYLMVSGGLLTKYTIDCEFEKFFAKVKKFNTFIEVYKTEYFIMLNLVCGLPFIPYNNILISPLELKTIFRKTRHEMNLPIFGPSCSESSKEMAAYASDNKKIVATSYMKNRFTSCKNAEDYFEYTAENFCLYLNENQEKFNHEKSTLQLKTLFTSHPQTTGDSFILSRDLNCGNTIYHRSRLEFNIQTDVNFYSYENISSKDCCASYDNNMNIVRKYICIGMIHKIRGSFKYRIYPQTKIFIIKNAHRGGIEYNVYKYFDEQHLLANDFDVFISSICDLEKKKIHLDLVVRIKTGFIDGMKLSEECSQRGICVQQDLGSRYKSRPDVVGSIFSILGRNPIIQLKKMSETEQVSSDELCGNVDYIVCKNIAATMKSYAPLKLDLYSQKIMSTNGLTNSIYTIQQSSLDRNEYGKFLPKESESVLGILNSLKIGVNFVDEFQNKRKILSFIDRDDIVDEIVKKKRIKKDIN